MNCSVLPRVFNCYEFLVLQTKERVWNLKQYEDKQSTLLTISYFCLYNDPSIIMWQFWVEIRYYSIMYFDHVIVF